MTLERAREIVAEEAVAGLQVLDVDGYIGLMQSYLAEVARANTPGTMIVGMWSSKAGAAIFSTDTEAGVRRKAHRFKPA